MPLSINTNLASLNAQRSFLNNNSALETHSKGFRRESE
jgi:flagellin-like hook-associated protein FlgL